MAVPILRAITILLFCSLLTLMQCVPARPYTDEEPSVSDENEQNDQMNSSDRLPFRILNKRTTLRRTHAGSCIRRGENCGSRPDDCCYSGACRCNLWGTFCRCARLGFF